MNTSLLIDANVHLAQFHQDDMIRIRAKNIHTTIQLKHTGMASEQNVFISFGENTEIDHFVREQLSRSQQDIYYPYMDVFHSLYAVRRVRDATREVCTMTMQIAHDFPQLSDREISLVAVAKVYHINHIATLSFNLLDEAMSNEIAKRYSIMIHGPHAQTAELSYRGSCTNDEGTIFVLEDLYQRARTYYNENSVNIYEKWSMHTS